MSKQPILKRLTNRAVQLNDEQLAALAPSEDEAPAPAPAMTLSAEIVSNACDGVLLRYLSADGSFQRTFMQRNLMEALATAQQQFGIAQSEWQAGDVLPPFVAPKRNNRNRGLPSR